MTDVICTNPKNTTHEKFAKLLKLSNNNESIQFDKKTVIEFTKNDWEILNNEFSVEVLNNTSDEDIKLCLELIYEKDNISYYYCYDFTIDNIHPLGKIQKELETILEELKKAEHYIKEAYKHLHNTKPSDLEKDKNKSIFSGFEFRELGILTLVRIYDDHKEAVSLPNIIKRIDSNFDKWLKVPKYKLEEKNLDKTLIVPDLNKLSKSKDAVSKLFKQRDKSIAHLDRAYVFRLFKTSEEQKRLGFPVQSELEELITIVKELCDRYSTAINLPLDEN